MIDIFSALNFIFGNKFFPVTKYSIKNLMRVSTNTLSYHVICKECSKYLGKYSAVKGTIQCECGEIVNADAMGSFFIELNIMDQLSKLFSNPAVVRSLDERFNRKKNSSENLEDIYDGHHYKDKTKQFLKVFGIFRILLIQMDVNLQRKEKLLHGRYF